MDHEADPPGHTAALSGLTVLELTHELPGAYCGRLLAMLGARVIKIESVERPDRSRLLGPFREGHKHPGESGSYRFLHAQKESLSLSVDTPAGFDLLRRLAATADVVLDDGALGSPAVASKRYDELIAANPRLIVNAFTSYGLNGPKADWKSTQITELAAGGWMRPRAGGLEPLMPGAPCAHYGAGVLGALGVLLAMTARRRFGHGQVVETPLNEALLSLLAFPTATFAISGSDGVRLGERFPFAIYPCLDGHLGVSILTQGHWEGLCRLMKRDDLLTNPRFITGTARARPETTAEIDQIVGDWIATQPALETFDTGQSLRVPIAIVPSPSEVLKSPHYAARDYWHDYDDPDLGPIRLPGIPFIFASGEGFAPFRPAPWEPASTESILASFSGAPPQELEVADLAVTR